MAVAAVKRAARDAGTAVPIGPLTRRALAGFRRTEAASSDPKTAERRGLVDGAIVALLFYGALRRSEVAALRWADVDFRDGDDVVGQRPPLEVRSDRGACRRAASGRRLRGRGPRPARRGRTGTEGGGRRPSASTRSTAGSPPPAPRAASRGAGQSHGGRVGLAVELTARGASTHAHPARRRVEGPRPRSSATPRASAFAREPSARYLR